jgi:BlaI family penicillinase repressor
MAGSRPILLTKLELEVMRPVWEAQPGTLTARDVVERLNAARRPPLAYNTVQTVLKILEEKRVVRSQRGSGRAHLFAPRVSRDQVSTSMIGDLVERLFDGDVEPLLVRLVDREHLSRDELLRLRARIEAELDDGDGREPARDA